jgi:hypothetical protein
MHNPDVSLCDQTWIGMQDLTHNRDWSWTDGSPTDFYYWAPGEPSNSSDTACEITYKGEYCVQLYSDNENVANDLYHWNDFACAVRVRAFVCKRAASFF